MNLVIEEEFSLAQLTPNANTIDLQPIESLDAFGVVTLVCLIQDRATTQQQTILPGRADVQQWLSKIGFFTEVTRRCQNQVIGIDETLPMPMAASGNDAFTSVRYSTPGDERRVADDFRQSFGAFGYGEDLLNIGGCIIGEAGDNSRAHAHCSSHFMVNGTFAPRNLRIGIADLGSGLLTAFRRNPNHSHLDDNRALLTSLLARHSGTQTPRRGNGLTELLKWTMTLKGTLRIDSGGRTLKIECGTEEVIARVLDWLGWSRIGEIYKSHSKYHGLTPALQMPVCDGLRGTRIGVILEDRTAVDISRQTANDLVEQFLRKL